MNQLQLEINNQYDSLSCPIEATRKLFRALEASGTFPIRNGVLSIAFVTDAVIAQVHKTFMDDPSATDVITFPTDPKMNSAGEIIVSVDHALDRAKELNEPFSRELSLYLIHGWLHLAGYDDRSKKDRKAMRAAEQKAMTIVEQAAAVGNFKTVNQLFIYFNNYNT
jgi:probable rRNA maturation factor